MAPGNAGLIGLKKDPANGKAQKCIEAQAGGNAEAGCDDYGAGEVAGAKPIKVIKKKNRAAAKKATFKADRANAAKIELAQRPGGAAGSVVGCLGEEARSEGRVGRGGHASGQQCAWSRLNREKVRCVQEQVQEGHTRAIKWGIEA